MKLTFEAVSELMRACLIGTGDPANVIEVDGITHQFVFDRAKIAEHTSTIGELLAELPNEFQASGGGGWSFLNACMDKHGDQWTGLHAVQEALFVLGIAAGKAKWLLPRDMWHVLPGGMPYVMVDPT